MLTAEASTPGADVAHAGHLEHPLDGAVLAPGPVQQREDHVDLAERARRLRRLGDDQVGRGGARGPARRWRGRRRPAGSRSRPVDAQPLGVAGLQHPAAVRGDADRHHVVLLAVDGREHAARRDAGDRRARWSVPPKTTATRGLRPGCGRAVSSGHGSSPMTLSGLVSRRPMHSPPPSPSPPAARRTSRTSRSTSRSPWPRRTSRAATSSTAATATRPGRRSRRRSARSRAGGAWRSPPAWPRSRPCSTWSAQDAHGRRARGTPTTAPCMPARRPRGPRPAPRRARRHHRHRRRGRGLRGRRAGLAGVADQPGAGGRRHRDDRRRRPRGRAPTSSSTTPSPRRCSSSR